MNKILLLNPSRLYNPLKKIARRIKEMAKNVTGQSNAATRGRVKSRQLVGNQKILHSVCPVKLSYSGYFPLVVACLIVLFGCTFGSSFLVV